MHISARGLALIEGFEGFSSTPYWDPFGNVWTRGYGETEGISQTSPAISRAQAEENLRWRIEHRYEWALRGLNVPLNQNQWDALCSFAWNLGAGIFTGNLRAALQRREWLVASRIMLQYVHAGGVVLPGLVRRRQAEMRLFLTPVVTDEPLWELTEPERDAVDSFDAYAKHPWLHPHGLRVTLAEIVGFRRAIEGAVRTEVVRRYRSLGAAWRYRHRDERWRILTAREKRKL
jgi:GH24 family phage-related lysozyme (muramidase)